MVAVLDSNKFLLLVLIVFVSVLEYFVDTVQPNVCCEILSVIRLRQCVRSTTGCKAIESINKYMTFHLCSLLFTFLFFSFFFTLLME